MNKKNAKTKKQKEKEKLYKQVDKEIDKKIKEWRKAARKFNKQVCNDIKNGDKFSIVAQRYNLGVSQLNGIIMRGQWNGWC